MNSQVEPKRAGGAATMLGGVLRSADLVKRYGQRTVVDRISIEVCPGEIVGLLGPNGAGKTTTFYMMVGLIRPNGGHVYLGERDITRLPIWEADIS